MRKLGWKIFCLLAISVIGCPSVWGVSGPEAEDLSIPLLPSEPMKAVATVFPSRPGDLFVELKNGLTVLIREIHTSQVVSTQVLVKTGSIHEDRYLNGGLSHYLEHIVAGGTTTRFTEDEAKERIQSMGGASNAYTSYDRTVYFINTTSCHYQEALGLLLSYVTECTIDPQTVERERAVIQQEMRLGDNDPDRQLWKLFMKTAYQVHPVGSPIIGHEDVFVQITRDQLYDYYQRRYTPPNMLVTVVGDVDAKEALVEVIRLVGELDRGFEEPLYIPEEPPQVGPRRVEKEFAAARMTSMSVGFPSVTLKDPDLYALDVLAIILGSGRTSRLYRRLKDEDERVLSVSAFNWTPSFARGLFGITMSLEGKNREGAMESLWEEIAELKDRGPKKRELEKAKRQVVADQIFANQSADRVASGLATSYAATGDPYFDERYVTEIQRVTAKDVLRVARSYLRRDRTTLAVISPPGEGAERSEAGIVRQARVAEVKRRVLPNGMVLLTREDRRAPIVAFQLFGSGGVGSEPPDQTGISQFTFRLLSKGTTRRSKDEISQAMEEIGGRIESGSGRHTYFVGVSVLKEDFERGLKVLADIVTHPSFPKEEIEKQRSDTLLAIRRAAESWEWEVERLFLKNYYGDHPYANDVMGTETSVQRLNRDDIIGFYRKLVTANNTVLAIFGDFDANDIEAEVFRAFRDLGRGVSEKPIRNVTPPAHDRDEEVQEITDKVSAGVYVGYNGLSLLDRDRPVMDVIDAIVSGVGYPSGWLHESLRGGGTSLVYFVHAFPSYGVDVGHFGVLTQTTMKNYQQVLHLIDESMKKIREEPVSDGELERGKNMVLTMHELGRETIGAQAYEAALSEVLGLGFDWGKRYRELVLDVSQEDILRVAQKCFRYRMIASTIPREPVETVIPPEQRERMHVQ